MWLDLFVLLSIGCYESLQMYRIHSQCDKENNAITCGFMEYTCFTTLIFFPCLRFYNPLIVTLAFTFWFLLNIIISKHLKDIDPFVILSQLGFLTICCFCLLMTCVNACMECIKKGVCNRKVTTRVEVRKLLQKEINEEKKQQTKKLIM